MDKFTAEQVEQECAFILRYTRPIDFNVKRFEMLRAYAARLREDEARTMLEAGTGESRCT